MVRFPAHPVNTSVSIPVSPHGPMHSLTAIDMGFESLVSGGVVICIGFKGCQLKKRATSMELEA